MRSILGCVYDMFLYIQIIVECDGNKYGQDCRQTCGNCTDGEQCDHVNGICKNGCDAGMMGDTCDQCKHITRFQFIYDF